MDEKTAELRDIFIEATGADTVTETQQAERGSLTADERRARERVATLVETMRERYDFETDLSDDALVELVERFFDEEDDEQIAAALDSDAETVFRARLDLHLLREADRDAPVDLEELRSLVAEGSDLATCAAELDVEEPVVRRYYRVIEARNEARRANYRFSDEFAELLTDSDLSGRLASDARESGLQEATEDMETDVSF
jgi:hypothetical protein